MKITIDTAQPLSPWDRKTLLSMLGTDTRPGGTVEDPWTGESVPAEQPPENLYSAGAGEQPGEEELDEGLLEKAIKRTKNLLVGKDKQANGEKIREVLDENGFEKVTALNNNEDLRAYLAGLDAKGLA